MLETEFGKSKEINEQKRKMLEALAEAEGEEVNDSGDDETGDATPEQQGQPRREGKRKAEEGNLIPQESKVSKSAPHKPKGDQKVERAQEESRKKQKKGKGSQ